MKETIRVAIVKIITVVAVVSFWFGLAGVQDMEGSIQAIPCMMIVLSGAWMILFSISNRDWLEK